MVKNQPADDNLAQQTYALKEQKNQQNALKKDLPVDPNTRFDGNMIVSRLIGFKKELPGSAQWQMLMRPENECWICENYRLTYFFWNDDSVAETQVATENIQAERIFNKL